MVFLSGGHERKSLVSVVLLKAARLQDKEGEIPPQVGGNQGLLMSNLMASSTSGIGGQRVNELR